jgi:hypothetical protein
MRLAMFHPVNQPMERGWVGRVDGDHVVHLAAQTLESFFTGGGTAREHAVYPLEGVRLLAPVLHPPAVRVFDADTTFEFANPTAIRGPNSHVVNGCGNDWFAVDLRPRLAAVVGAEGEIAGLTLFADWRAPTLPVPKDRDFAHGLGPVVVTMDEAPERPEGRVRVRASGARSDGDRLRGRFEGFNWSKARDFAAERTALRPGDILAGPALGVVETIEPAASVEIEIDGIGTLVQSVHPEAELA